MTKISHLSLICALVIPFTWAFSASSASAEIQTRTVIYSIEDKQFEGFLALPEDLKEGESAPGVLIVHDWMGLQEDTKNRAIQIAKLGYPAFAADIYGQGIRPTSSEEAGAQAGKYKKNTDLFRKHVTESWKTMLAQPEFESTASVAIGYCFGGTGVLELARSGADIQGVVSFHGNLATDKPASAPDAPKITASIFVMHGAVDPFVPESEVVAFIEEVNAAKADWQLISFSDAVHSFTKEAAGDDPSTGSAYNKRADQRSWAYFQTFLKEIFQR